MRSMLKTKVSTKAIAGALFIPHNAVITHLINMVSRGLFDKGKLKTKCGRIDRDAELWITWRDITALAVHIEASGDGFDRMLDAFEAAYLAKGKGERKAEQAEARVMQGAIGLRRMFTEAGNSYVLAIRYAAASQGDGAKTILSSCRLHRGELLIGTGTAAIVAIAKTAGIPHVEITRMLMTVPGAQKVGTRRFDGFASRAVAMSAASFMAAIGARPWPESSKAAHADRA